MIKFLKFAVGALFVFSCSGFTAQAGLCKRLDGNYRCGELGEFQISGEKLSSNPYRNIEALFREETEKQCELFFKMEQKTIRAFYEKETEALSFWIWFPESNHSLAVRTCEFSALEESEENEEYFLSSEDEEVKEDEGSQDDFRLDKPRKRTARPKKITDAKKERSCSECGKSFKEGWVLKRHMLSHTNERNYVCQGCGKAFKQSGHLSGHRKSCLKSVGKKASKKDIWSF